VKLAASFHRSAIFTVADVALPGEAPCPKYCPKEKNIAGGHGEDCSDIFTILFLH